MEHPYRVGSRAALPDGRVALHLVRDTAVELPGSFNPPSLDVILGRPEHSDLVPGDLTVLSFGRAPAVVPEAPVEGTAPTAPIALLATTEDHSQA